MANPDIEDLLQDIRASLTAAFNRGVRVGRDEMRQSILKAAETVEAEGEAQSAPKPVVVSAPPRAESKRISPKKKKRRSPRGSTAILIKGVLSIEPALSKMEIVARLREDRPDLSMRTVGNTLSLNPMFRLNGKKWSLFKAPQTNEAPTNSTEASLL